MVGSTRRLYENVLEKSEFKKQFWNPKLGLEINLFCIITLQHPVARNLLLNVTVVPSYSQHFFFSNFS
jgi:hypothetical protein